MLQKIFFPLFVFASGFPAPPFPSVPVVVGLERTLDRDVQVRGLVLGQLCELHLERLEVRGGHLLVKGLGQHVDSDVVLAGVGPQVDLGQDLKKRMLEIVFKRQSGLHSGTRGNPHCAIALKINIKSLRGLLRRLHVTHSAPHTRANQSELRTGGRRDICHLSYDGHRTAIHSLL